METSIEPGTASLQTSSTRFSEASYVDWPAIFAGTVVAVATSAVFLTFGSAIGLSLTGIDTQSSATVLVVIGMGLWLIVVQLAGLMVGGYVAGRLRRVIGDAVQHEKEVRDGMHGLTVWAISVLAAAVLAAMAAGQAISLGSSAVSNLAGSDAGRYLAERLMRSDPAGGTNAGSSTQQGANPVDVTARILANAKGFNLAEEDRNYIASLMAANSGITLPEARTRLDANLSQAANTAAAARRIGVVSAFVTAATLLIGALAAWWAAVRGGSHRDTGVDHSRYTTWR